MAAALAVRDDAAELVVLERGDDVGGVWRENTYPGAACDVPSHLYSFSFAPEHRWSRRFAPQPDIQRYLRRVVDDHGLRRHLRLRTEVTEARWDEAAATWRLTTTTGDTVEVEVLVAACGQLTRPARPRWRGSTPSGVPSCTPRTGITRSTCGVGASPWSAPAPAPSRSCRRSPTRSRT